MVVIMKMPTKREVVNTLAEAKLRKNQILKERYDLQLVMSGLMKETYLVENRISELEKIIEVLERRERNEKNI